MDHSENYLNYLIIEKYFENFTEISALITAFRSKLIDYLVSKKYSTYQNLMSNINLNDYKLKILLDVLISYNILKLENNHFKLTENFKNALKFRDLLEWKLWYTRLVCLDLLNNCSVNVNTIHKTKPKNITNFWDYYDKTKYSKSQFIRIKTGVKFTSILTKYDSQSLIKNYDFDKSKKILDVGGNSGELALQLCKHFKNIEISIFDLPVICSIGNEYIAQFSEKDRIKFIKGNLLTDSLPDDFDTIIFKSVLHDWSENNVILFLKKAYESLTNGGKIILFEFEKLDCINNKLLDKDMIWIPFSNSFRKIDDYIKILSQIGFKNIKSKKIKQINFFLITGEK